MTDESKSSLINFYNVIGSKKRKNNCLGFPSPMRLLILSPSGGGKSNLLMNLCYKLVISKQIKTIYLVAVTPDEPLYQFLVKKFPNIEVLDATPEDPKALLPKSLLVLDDQIVVKKNKIVNNQFFIFGRKGATDGKGVDIAYLTQSLTDVDTLNRKNVNMLLFKKVANLGEKLILCQMTGLSRDRLDEFLATDEWIAHNKVTGETYVLE